MLKHINLFVKNFALIPVFLLELLLDPYFFEDSVILLLATRKVLGLPIQSLLHHCFFIRQDFDLLRMEWRRALVKMEI